MVKSRPYKLLVIDEISYTRLMLSQTLSSDGYRVVTAKNSGEAMQHIAKELPDVILFSLRPTDTNSTSGLRNLKDYFRLRLDVAQGAEPAIILLGDFRDSNKTRELQSLGVSNSLSKPVNMQELLDTVREAIANRSSAIPEKRMKIMLFDGETRSQQFLESFIAHEIYDIDKSDTEAELLAKLKNRKYDLLIVDLTSFESDIIDVLKNIKDMIENMPIITIATSADQVSQDDLTQLDIHMHFIKPLDVNVFRSEVDGVLQEQEEEPDDEDAAEDAEQDDTEQAE